LVAGMETDSDTGNLATKCALCVHVPSGDGELHSAIQQGRCLPASLTITGRNALIQKAITRDMTTVILHRRYDFVVLGPQVSSPKLGQPSRTSSAGSPPRVSISGR